MELIFRARHGDIKEPAFFFDLLAGSDAQVRRYAAVDGVQHEYGFPFQALRRMDCREDEIVLVEQRRSRLVAGRAGWVERELGQEALAVRVSRRDHGELGEIGLTNRRVFVEAL